MLDYVKNWIEKNGPVPTGYEIHHKTPVRLGGTDDIDNLEIVTRAEHALRHLALYEKYGDPKDYCASRLLSGVYPDEVRREMASIGGKIGGEICKSRGSGICTTDPRKRRIWASMGGTASQKTLQKKKLSAFYDPTLRHTICSLGGKSGMACLDYYTKLGLTTEEAKERRKEHQSKAGKRGGIKNRGKVWLTDGTIECKVDGLDVQQYIQSHKSFRRGRLPRKKK